MKKVLCLLLTLLLVCSCFLSSCDNKNDTDGKPANGHQTDGGGSSAEGEDSDYIKVKTIANTIRQENKENDVNIILVNDKTALTVDELFSYTDKYTVDIYALSDSSIDYAKKEMSLNIGYNHFQIKFKNLSDYSETFFDIEVFRDPGIITREFSKNHLRKEITTSTDKNGLPKFDLKISLSDGLFGSVDVNGEKLPAQVVECNLKVDFTADFYIDPENYLGISHHTMKTLQIIHTFADLKQPFETTINFPQSLWDDFCSKYPYATLANTKQGLDDRDLSVGYGSYISLRVDYSQYQFD